MLGSERVEEKVRPMPSASCVLIGASPSLSSGQSTRTQLIAQTLQQHNLVRPPRQSLLGSTSPRSRHTMSTDGPRARDQRPCDSCRKRKIRCLFGSEEAINCVLCISRQTECTYLENAPPKKRRRSQSADRGKPGPKPKSSQRYFMGLSV